MAIALGTSPATVVTPSSTFPTALTTAAFSPPDNSLLVACWSGTLTGTSPPTMSNSGTARTWSLLTSRVFADQPFAAIYAAPNPTALTNITATATGTDLLAGLKLYVLTGADLGSPAGATGNGNTVDDNVTANGYTSTVAGSRGVCAAYDANNRGLPASTDSGSPWNITTPARSGILVIKAANTPAPATVTFNMNASGTLGGDWQWCAAEIKPEAEGRPIRILQALTAVHHAATW
ncbi:hypothetical protein ACFFV7_50910 [Nonomuraea spiralis]|uniref:Uncharacterized protein n=1 Tax=Nonomuraea spiralis TaxID=46182 RepID=A0ABV5IZ99_9ACTN|nr:hypothetical protein [Nonomuraea spiralis]GGS88574.1 hypothetical protein GCM10010176_035440 [Nonomuraea spiralis]